MPSALTHPDATSNLDIAGSDAITADGAITIKNGSAVITKSTAAALTLALPTTGTDDGKKITIFSDTAAAHTITTPTNGINNSTLHIATFAAAIGSSVTLMASGGKWKMIAAIGITLS